MDYPPRLWYVITRNGARTPQTERLLDTYTE